jgi:hypothetical protein
MARLRQQEAKALIAEELRRFSTQYDARTAIHQTANAEARAKNWWLHFQDAETADTERSIALLRAYKAIGAGRMWAEGLPLENGGRIYMDRSVMRRFLLSGHVEWVEGSHPHFEITPLGDELIK